MGSDIKNITTQEWEETVEVVEQFKDILNDEKKVNLAIKTYVKEKFLAEPLTPREASAILGVQENTLYKMLKKNVIKGFDVGENLGGVRISKDEIRRYKKKYNTKTYKKTTTQFNVKSKKFD